MENEELIFDEENGVFIFNDGSVPYCFYVTCSSIIDIEKELYDN